MFIVYRTVSESENQEVIKEVIVERWQLGEKLNLSKGEFQELLNFLLFFALSSGSFWATV